MPLFFRKPPYISSNVNFPLSLVAMITRSQLVEELVEYFFRHRFTVNGAKGLAGYKQPPSIRNDGFGDLRERIPDVIGMDTEQHRIVFGVIRTERRTLDAEESLTDYNVFLDHRHGAGPEASLLVVLLPPSLITEFTHILTHYIHREYRHRVVGVSSTLMT